MGAPFLARTLREKWGLETNVTTYPKTNHGLYACHPERSTTTSKASGRAQSKDPYHSPLPTGFLTMNLLTKKWTI